MNFMSKFFQFLSKTDRNIIMRCTDLTVKTQTTYGVFVFLTASFAFLSCAYALHMALGWNKAAVAIATLYSLVIMFIDREIVSAQRKVTAIPRIALAIIIGLVISVPLELKLFEARVNEKIDEITKVKNQDVIERKRQDESVLQERVDNIENDIRYYRGKVDEATAAMQDELVGVVRSGKSRTGKPGRGSAYKEAETQKQTYENLVLRLESQLEEEKESQKERFDRINQEYNSQALDSVYDLLTRYIALEKLKSDPEFQESWYMVWGLRLLIIMIEVIPALMRILQEENEYNAIVEGERRKNIARIDAIENDHIDQLKTNPNMLPTPTLFEQLEQDPLTK